MRMGPQARDGLPSLLRAVKDDEAGVRAIAARALGRFVSLSPEARQALTRLLQTETHPAVRKEADKALQNRGLTQGAWALCSLEAVKPTPKDANRVGPSWASSRKKSIRRGSFEVARALVGGNGNHIAPWNLHQPLSGPRTRGNHCNPVVLNTISKAQHREISEATCTCAPPS